MITQQDLDRILGLLPNVTLSVSDKIYLCSLFESITLNKDDFFVNEKKIVDRVGFVISGSLRKYTENPNGGRDVIQLIVANCFFTDLERYYMDLSSQIHIQATTTCRLLTIRISDLKKLREMNMKFNDIIHQFAEMIVYKRTKIDRQLDGGTATERYHHFNSLYPDWDKSFLVCDVASRLNMSHANLCLIRKK